MLTPKNARARPLTKLCLALELFRRTDEGRVRDANAFLGHFFPQSKSGAIDRLFAHLPNEVRADLLSNWGIRGKKSALRDDDERVRTTVVDALAAGDIDATVIENGVTAEILVDWVPLDEWWTFWRGSSLPIEATRRALALARELALFDDRWFFSHLTLPSQKLAGTDVVCAALSKEQAAAWVQAVHRSGDASPAGLVAAIGWDTILGKTAHEALLHALDAVAKEVGLGPGRDDRVKAADPAVEDDSLAPLLANLEPAPLTAREETRPLERPAATPEAIEAPIAKATVAKPASLPPPKSPVAESKPVGPAPPSMPPPKPSTPESKPALPAKPAATTKPAVKSPVAKPAVPVPSASATAATRSAPPPPPASAPSVIVERDPPSHSHTQSKPQVQPLMVEPDPFASPPISRPDPRTLFGPPSSPPVVVTSSPQVVLAPMRPPAATLSGVGPVVGGVTPPVFESKSTNVAPTVERPETDPPWAPPRAEPGDMGWDIVYGVQRTMATSNVHPKYNFEEDDEPTSEIDLLNDPKFGRP